MEVFNVPGPKFKVGDLVTTTANPLKRIYTIAKVYRANRLLPAYDLVDASNGYTDFTYEGSLRLLTPEERTKLLLGIDLDE